MVEILGTEVFGVLIVAICIGLGVTYIVFLQGLKFQFTKGTFMVYSVYLLLIGAFACAYYYETGGELILGLSIVVMTLLVLFLKSLGRKKQ